MFSSTDKAWTSRWPGWESIMFYLIFLRMEQHTVRHKWTNNQQQCIHICVGNTDCVKQTKRLVYSLALTSGTFCIGFTHVQPMKAMWLHADISVKLSTFDSISCCKWTNSFNFLPVNQKCGESLKYRSASYFILFY